MTRLIVRKKKRYREQHGLSGTLTWNRWRKMKDRCDSKSCGSYERYGGVGVKYSERWISFMNFLADMGECPSEEYSLDRIDNTKGYEPGNCRWIPKSAQAGNRKHCRRYAYKGEMLLAREIAEKIGVERKVLVFQLKRFPVLTAIRRALNLKNLVGKDQVAKSSGFRGVSRATKNRTKPWAARISVDGRDKYLGYFKTKTEAALAYDKAAKEAHGCRARLNFPEVV